jgi:hypothetical protein
MGLSDHPARWHVEALHVVAHPVLDAAGNVAEVIGNAMT